MYDTTEIKRILNANYPITFIRIEFLRDGGSLSFAAFTEDGKYFLRLIRPELMATALPSIDIHMYLQKKGFSVPSVILTNQEEPCIKTPDQLYVLYEYIDGGKPDFEDVERVGELIGELHQAMEDYPGELKEQDKYFFIDRYVNILESKNHPRTEEYRQLGEKLWDKVREIPRGYCHCDLYKGNILKSADGRLYVLDFDTSCSAFPMYDIVLFCNETDYFTYSDEGYEESVLWLERFIDGYKKYRTLTREEIEAYYYFHLIYHYQLQATIVEIYGLHCNEEDFEDRQFDWMMRWLEKAKKEAGIIL